MILDKERGIYYKYNVERVDGKFVDFAFVIEDTDPFAVPALRAYADAAGEAGYGKLAEDLRTMADQIEKNLKGKK